jgi:hypothetical protein
MNDSAAYYGSDASGGNANQIRGHGTMYQGGTTASGGSYNGTMKSACTIGGNPQSDLSGKTIDKVTVRLEWQHCWYNNGAYVNLGYANFTSLGGSWSGGGITAVKTSWQGPATDQGGGTFTIDVTGTGLGNAMASGAARALTFGPGPAYNANYYGYLYGAGGDNNQNPLITVDWHTGSAPVKAGSGADGKVVITYYISGVLTSALQPVAGTDSLNNAFASGYTGPVKAFNPSAVPAAVEGWHSLTPLPSGLTGSVRYKLIAENNCMLLDVNVSWSSTGTFTLPLFPAGYVPSTPGQARIYTMQGNAGQTALGSLCRLYISGGGAQVITGNATGSGSVTVVLPLD